MVEAVDGGGGFKGGCFRVEVTMAWGRERVKITCDFVSL